MDLLKIDPKNYGNIPQDMDQKNPDSFNDVYSMTDAVMIRSYQSRDLNKNSNLV